MRLAGLTQTEAELRLRTEGPNELPSARPRRGVSIALGVLREPMFLLLLGAALVYVLLGDLDQALLLTASISLIIGIAIYQEHKTVRALESLRDLTSPRALVVRDGERRRVPGREVVCGDLVVLSEGDRVPADGVLLSSHDLAVDESLLTGESLPVGKNVADSAIAIGPPGGGGTPFIYGGTLVIRGQGIAEIRSTGPASEIGRIGKALQRWEVERTPLQRQTGVLARQFATVSLLVCVLVVAAYGLTRSDWLDGLLVGITLAMSLLPEEIPVVLTVFLAIGAWRIAQQGVLTRRPAAIEALGSATTLCVDKTGTLTLNQMTVTRLAAGDEEVIVPNQPTGPIPRFADLMQTSILASEDEALDPLERALVRMGREHLAGWQGSTSTWELVHEYPLTPTLLAMTHVWRNPDDPGGSYLVATKGAPETIAALCRFDAAATATLDKQVTSMASDGLRVLGVARASFGPAPFPEHPDAFTFHFLGLVGLSDPLRPSAAAAVAECRSAGIRVVMITGDYPETARAIAEQIGLGPDEIVSGRDLEQLTETGLRERVRAANVFARVTPDLKLRLVQALKANGEIVAMTGDGVNDAPALQAAHIGVAMGSQGTDVAREAAALVLVDDDFASLVRAIRIGRRVYDNVRKALAYILAVHIPIAGVALVPVLVGWPLVLLPIHIVFLEMIIDPVCSIVFEAEPEEPDVMQRPPRDPAERLLNARQLVPSVVGGLASLIAVLSIFAAGLNQGAEEDARALAFATLIVGNVGLLLISRSKIGTIAEAIRPVTRPLLWIVAGAMGFLAVTLTVPFARELFSFGAVEPQDLAVAAGAGIAGTVAAGLAKRAWGRPRMALNARASS